MSRMDFFESLRTSFHVYYQLEHIEKYSDELVIVFSPHASPALRTYKFERDVLYISDRKLYYYLTNPGRQTSLLKEFCLRSNYRKIIFIGSSKGGTGAMLWPALMSKNGMMGKVWALAFSPQLKLYPFNPNLKNLPKYVSNIELTQQRPGHLANFVKYGDIAAHLLDEAPPTLLTYGVGSRMEAHEARYLEGLPNITLNPINVSFHGSIVPYVVDTSDIEAMRVLAKKLCNDARDDSDLKATFKISEDDFLSELTAIEFPTLKNLIDEFSSPN